MPTGARNGSDVAQGGIPLLTVISGGQTGVDRAALDVALELGLRCTGWCPRGRLAEDGPLPARYPLRETPSSEYPQRTRWNIRDADGTLILHAGGLDRGSALTERIAEQLRRPVLVLDARTADPSAIRDWMDAHAIARLNVAGPRESRSPGIYERASRLLRAVWSDG
jgi:predicted Rossmann fold nucleotide-binding protein DprA/Smf involved in DNA uptake